MTGAIREHIHVLGNELQIVLGYLELGRYAEAKPHIELALKHLNELRKELRKL